MIGCSSEPSDEQDGGNAPDTSISEVGSDAVADVVEDPTPDSDTSDDSDASEPNYVFVAFEGLTEPPDVTTDRLCAESADPEAAPYKIFIDCAIEGANLAPPNPEPVDELIVMAYNFERGVHLDEQIAMLRDDPTVPLPDVILASEVDRGCSRSGSRNVMWDLAETLGYNYAFAVEFVELPRPSGSGGTISEMCEHGNAIASRFPIGNVRQIRHAENLSWYIPLDERDQGGEPRLGGRIAVAADILVGDRVLHAYVVHFESDISVVDVQVAQAVEMAEDGLAQPFDVVIGGDTNAPLYFFDLQTGSQSDRTTQAFFERGYVDSHAPLPFERRGTLGTLVIDILFGDEDFFRDPGICSTEVCGDLSDHLPIWATVDL